MQQRHGSERITVERKADNPALGHRGDKNKRPKTNGLQCSHIPRQSEKRSVQHRERIRIKVKNKDM